MSQIAVNVVIRRTVPIRVVLSMKALCQDLTLVQNDTGPSLLFQIRDDNDQPIDISGWTIKFILKRFCMDAHVNQGREECVITNGPMGEATYNFKTGDLVNLGTHFGDVQVTRPGTPDAITETSPEVVRIVVRGNNQ